MTHTTRIILLLPVLALGPAALAHCSGDDTNLSGKGKPQADASITPGSSGSGGDDATGSEGDGASPGPTGDGGSSPGLATDGGVDAAPPGPAPIPVPEGGAPSDPGSIVCNGAACDVTTGQTCCYARTDAGGAETCNVANAGCATQVIACNEASDCKGGICCQTIIGVGLQGSTFCTDKTATTCPPASAMYPQGTFQTCRTDAECAPGSDAGALKRCVPQLCTNPEAPADSVTVEACAQAPSAVNRTDAGTLEFCKPL